jgi:hypothetical protein
MRIIARAFMDALFLYVSISLLLSLKIPNLMPFIYGMF